MTAWHTSKPFFLGIITSRKTIFGFFAANGFERLFAVGRGEKLYAFVFEFLKGLLDQRAQMRFVVNNKDFHGVH